MSEVLHTMNKGSESAQIDINGLPKDIILNILMRLSIQEAVKTSILSRNWRYAWTELRQLVFDDSFCEKSISNTKSKLIIAIYQVLLLHNGPLCKFTLCLRNLDSSCSHIDQFLLVALKRGVKDLMIKIIKGNPYNSPSSIFEYGQQLERLVLRICVFKTPLGFNGFSKLETLELEEVSICGNRLSNLVSNCPLLRWLLFVGYSSTGCFDIVAPNLEYLKLYGHGMSICFKTTPRLAEVEIYFPLHTGNIEASGDFMLSGRLPVVEKLTLDEFYSQATIAGRAQKSLVDDLSNLKALDLALTRIDRDVMFSLISFTRNIPHVEKLAVSNHASEVKIEVVINYIKMEGFSDVTLGSLREVEFLGASGLYVESQFIEFILAKSPVLEKFSVGVNAKLACKEKLEFCQEFTRFRRTSPRAEIVYIG